MPKPPQVSVPYVNTPWTQALHIFHFMWYDAPRAVRIGDNSLNLAQAYLTLALASSFSLFSRTKCVAQIEEIGNIFQLHIGLNHAASFSKTDWKRPFSLFNFPDMLLLWTHLTLLWTTLYTSDWVAHNSLPATSFLLTRHCMTCVLSAFTLRPFASIPFFHFLNFSIINSSDSAIKTRSSA